MATARARLLLKNQVDKEDAERAVFLMESMLHETGKGLQGRGFRGRGDQYVRLVVNIPKKLSKHQKDLFKGFRRFV